MVWVIYRMNFFSVVIRTTEKSMSRKNAFDFFQTKNSPEKIVVIERMINHIKKFKKQCRENQN